MIQVLKFKDSDEQRVWFLSDIHWNHNPSWPIPIWKARGYHSLEESNRHIIERINNLVREGDVLFSLGDLTLNCSEGQFEGLIGALRCRKIYSLWGNHPNPMVKIYKREIEGVYRNFKEKCGNCLLDNFEIYPFAYKNLIFLGHHAEIVVNNQYIVLNHYPLSIWNYMKNSSWALVGHSHHGFKGSLPDNKNGKILDVGWDGYKKPLSFNEVKEIMDKKEVVKVDSHH